MKYVIILLIAVVLTVSYAKKLNPKVLSEDTDLEECKEHLKKTFESDDFHLESARKAVLCMATKSGLFDEHQGYIPERVAELFDSDKEEKEKLKVINGCTDKNEQKSSAEEWAFRGFLCLLVALIAD